MTTNPFDPSFVTDRYANYRELRDDHPVLALPLPGPTTWLVTRHEHVAKILKDPATTVRRPGIEVPDYLGDGPSARFYRVKMSMQDPPDHTRLRKLVSHGFTPRIVDQFRAEFAQIADQLLDELGERNHVDIVNDFAAELPATIICRLAGVPESDWPMLTAKALDFLPLLAPFPLDERTLKGTDDACQFYFDYFGAAVDDLLSAPPRNDLLGSLLAAEEEGSKLSRDELITTLESFVNAGYETTTSAIGNGVLGLLGQRGQLERLQREPALIPNGFEEILRWEAPVQFLFRFSPVPLRLLEVTIQPHELIMLGVGAANHDQRAFTDPERIDVGRPTTGQLSFGGGRHFCLGAHLARLEGHVALARLIERFPSMELAGDVPPRRPMAMFPALRSLPVVLDPDRP